MKNDHPKTGNPPSRQAQLWQPLNEDQSQSISGGGPLLFGNPFAFISARTSVRASDGLILRTGGGG